MSLTMGDHLVIKRGDKIIGPEDEAYHEFEVMQDPIYSSVADSEGVLVAAYEVGPIRIVA